MEKNNKLFLAVGIVGVGVFFFAACALAANPYREVKEGNRLYKQKKYDDALVKYNEALGKMPDSDIINFNEGTVLYQKGDYQKAIEAFTKVLTTEKSGLEARVNYNIGNCKYKQGKLKENTDLEKTIILYRESLDYYKRAIELDEKEKDAKYNHEFVEKKLKTLLDKLQQQQQQQQQQSGQQGQGEQQKEQNAADQRAVEQEQSDKSKEASGGEQKQGVNEKQDDKEQKVGKSSDKENKKENREEKTQQVQEAGTKGSEEMTEEQAQMILEGYRQEEASGQLQDRSRRRVSPDVEKDW